MKKLLLSLLITALFFLAPIEDTHGQLKEIEGHIVCRIMSVPPSAILPPPLPPPCDLPRAILRLLGNTLRKVNI